MSSSTLIRAAAPTIPTSTSKKAFTANTTIATALDLSAHKGRYVTFYGTADFRMRAGASDVAATAGDFPHKADQEHPRKIVGGGLYVSVRGIGAGDLFYAVTDS